MQIMQIRNLVARKDLDHQVEIDDLCEVLHLFEAEV